jgi:hypothetical protein
MHTTRGSDTRAPRTLDDAVMTFDVSAEADRLRGEPRYHDFGRSSKTLGKAHGFSLVLTTARAGVDLGAADADAPMAIHVLEGGLRVDREGDGTPLGPGSVAWLGSPGWSVVVIEDAVLLLSAAGAAAPEESGRG